jgi:SAM-dependent methyltransferase
MPTLDAPLHLNMLREFRAARIPLHVAVSRGYATRPELEDLVASGGLSAERHRNGTRMLSVAELESRFHHVPTPETYGLQWGDPDLVAPLQFIKNYYLLPLITPYRIAVEIGPGGGRWTRYLAHMRCVYAVDYHQALLDELAKNFDRPNIVRIRNNGTDFPGVPDGVADLVFSFDAFVHFDLPIIERYLIEMRRILKPTGVVFLHYSDKGKIMAARNPAFAENDPDTMRSLVTKCGYSIAQEDTTTMWHSSIIIFTL